VATTFDGANKRIILDVTSISASQIWTDWVDWLAGDTYNHRWPPALSQVGGDDLGSGLSIPIYIFLLNDWRVRPMESNHSLNVIGNLFVDGGGVPIVQTLGTYNVSAQYTVPVQAQGIVTSGSSGPTAAEIATAVRIEMDANSRLVIIEKLARNKMVTNPATGTLTIYDDDGTTVLFSGPLYEDVAQTIPYAGSGAQVRGRLT